MASASLGPVIASPSPHDQSWSSAVRLSQNDRCLGTRPGTPEGSQSSTIRQLVSEGHVVGKAQGPCAVAEVETTVSHLSHGPDARSLSVLIGVVPKQRGQLTHRASSQIRGDCLDSLD